jgi:hypothetical protein
MPQATPRHLDGTQIWKLTGDTYRHLSARRHKRHVRSIPRHRLSHCIRRLRYHGEHMRLGRYSQLPQGLTGIPSNGRHPASKQLHPLALQEAVVCGCGTSDTPTGEGKRAIRTAFSRNSLTSVFSNRDRTLPPQNTTANTELSATRPSNSPYSPAPRQCLNFALFARKTPDMLAPECPTPDSPNPTPRPQPKPKPPPRDTKDNKDPKPKNPGNKA